MANLLGSWVRKLADWVKVRRGVPEGTVATVRTELANWTHAGGGIWVCHVECAGQPVEFSIRGKQAPSPAQAKNASLLFLHWSDTVSRLGAFLRSQSRSPRMLHLEQEIAGLVVVGFAFPDEHRPDEANVFLATTTVLEGGDERIWYCCLSRGNYQHLGFDS